MSTTYRTQTHLFPTATHKLTGDGKPLHARMGIDLILGLNNLQYTYPFLGYVQSYNSKNTFSSSLHQAGMMLGLFNANAYTFPNGEYFIGQVPTFLPKVAAARFCWTLGIQLQATNTHTGDVTIQSITVYIAQSAYTGNVNGADLAGLGSWETDHPFDATKMGAPYGTSTNNCNITIAASTANPPYELVDNSAGTTGTWFPGTSSDDSFMRPCVLVVTATISRSGAVVGEANLGLLVGDFTWWVKPE